MNKLFGELPVLITILALVGGLQGAVFGLRADAVKAEKPGGAAADGESRGGAEEAPQRIFGIEGGYNGGYAEGSSPRNYYSQPYLAINLKHRFVKFTAGISRFWDFQITNGAGAYETVNFTQPKVALSIYPHEVVEIFGSYLYSAGDTSHYYKVHDGTGGFYLDFEVVSLGFTASYKKTDYTFKSDDKRDRLAIFANISPPLTPTENLIMLSRYRNFSIQNTKHLEDYTLSPTFSWFVIESTSIDLVYDYYYSDFKNPYSYKSIYTRQNENIIFYSHGGKIGVTSETCRYFTLTAMITSGWSNDKYITAGCELEGLVNLFDYASVSMSYAPVYSIAPPMNPMTRKYYELRSYLSIIRSELYGRRLSVSPFMQLKNIGKSFWSHGVSFNVSFRY